MVQPALVRTEKELALRADYRRRAIKAHAARAAKRTDRELLQRRASLPQNRTLGCEDRADFHAQLQDFIHAAKGEFVLAGSPVEASTAQPFMKDFIDNWEAEKSQARLLRRRWEDRPRSAGRGCLVPRRREVLRGRL